MATDPDTTRLVEALRATVQPLARARTLPAACYRAEAIHEAEQAALFPRYGLAVAREEDLPEQGSFVTREIGRERVLVVRGHDARIRAFYNVCRHRGSRLVEEASGRLRQAIVCPYHAWSYELDGRLRHASGLDACEAKGALDLVAVSTVLRDGFVFVRLDPAGAAATDTLVALPDWSRFGLEGLRRLRALEYRVRANWKLVCENYSECYHCPRAHPQLDRLSELSAGGFEEGPGYNGGPMQLRAGFDTLSMSGRSDWPHLAQGGDPADAHLVYYYLVYPNLMLGIHPDYLTVHSVWPEDAHASRVVCEILVPAETLALPQLDPQPVIEFWDLTNRQDWALCERVQRGVASRGYRPGPFAPSERCVHAFDRWYAQWLLARLESA